MNKTNNTDTDTNIITVTLLDKYNNLEPSYTIDITKILPTIICYSNFGYLQFAENFLINIHNNIKNHKVFFYCLDDNIYNALYKYSSNIITLILFKITNKISTSFQEYGTIEYNKITHTKISILQDALYKYGYIHFVDADVVFLKEPTIEYYNDYLLYDVIFQMDEPPPHPPFTNWSCTGNMVLKNTTNTHNLLLAIEQFQQNYNSSINDQECLKYMLDSIGINDIRNLRPVRLFQFPMEHFTCGYLVDHDMIDTNNIMVFHANHVTGTAAKIKLLQKLNAWYL